MKSSLILLNRALKGFIVMSDDLEKIANALYSNAVPIAWEKKSFNSLKPLSSWIDDINARIDFINNWIANGTPNQYWISGFFFP
jgi:dynein heavy chain